MRPATDHLHDGRRRHARRRRGTEDEADRRRPTGGTAYNVTDPGQLPAIYIKETRRVSQSFLYEQARSSRSCDRAAGRPTSCRSTLPPLYGFVRTTLKPTPLVEMAIEGPTTQDQRFPVLAYWQYGLGKCGGVHAATPARSRRRARLGPRLGRVGHVPEVLGAGGRLGAAGRRDRPADADDRVPRRQGPG